MKIAVAIDGSKNALRAVKHALNIVKYLPDQSLEIIHVINYDKIVQDHLLTQNSESLELSRQKMFIPIRKAAEEEQVNLNEVILRGQPASTLTEYASEHKLDLLIVGHRGLNRVQEALMGSVSHELMRRLKCPITIVK